MVKRDEHRTNTIMKTYLVISWSEEEFLVEAILLGINDQLRQLIEEYTSQKTSSDAVGIGRLEKLSLVYRLIGKCLLPPSISNYYDILVVDDDKTEGFQLARMGENHVKVIKTPNNFKVIKRKKGKIICIKLNV